MSTPEPRSPWRTMGVFFALFGACVLVAVGFTDDAAGRVVNLACGLSFLAVAAAFLRGRAQP